jgi:hypothetical protein
MIYQVMVPSSGSRVKISRVVVYHSDRRNWLLSLSLSLSGGVFYFGPKKCCCRPKEKISKAFLSSVWSGVLPSLSATYKRGIRCSLKLN